MGLFELDLYGLFRFHVESYYITRTMYNSIFKTNSILGTRDRLVTRIKN